MLCVRTTAGQATEEQAADQIETAENVSLSERMTYIVEVNLSEPTQGPTVAEVFVTYIVHIATSI